MFNKNETERRFWQGFVSVQVILTMLLAACEPAIGHEVDARMLVAVTTDPTHKTTSFDITYEMTNGATQDIQLQYGDDTVRDGSMLNRLVPVKRPPGVKGFLCAFDEIGATEADAIQRDWDEQISVDNADDGSEKVIYSGRCSRL